MVKFLAPRLWLLQVLFALIVSFGLSLFPLSSTAAIEGQDDPDFQAIVQAWLTDNDEFTLPELSRLAHDGNSAALTLLALIDKSTELQGPWLSLQSREKRKELLRAPGGRSGINWLRKSPNSVFAQTWLDVWSTNSTTEAALTFTDLGEHRAARTALMFLEARQGSGFAEARLRPGYPVEMHYLVWRQWLFEGDQIERIAQEMNALDLGDPQRGIIGSPPDPVRFEQWLISEPAGEPLRSLCQTICPASIGSCSRAAFYGIGGYRRLMALGSPVAAIIPEDVFVRSRRAHMAVIRTALLREQLSEHRLNRISDIDACFARAVDDEGQNF